MPPTVTRSAVPILRLMEITVPSGLVMAWRFATWPTMRSPVLENATTEGVVLPPSALGMTMASPPSITETQELVVPRSIPMILDIVKFLLYGEKILTKGFGSFHCRDGGTRPQRGFILHPAFGRADAARARAGGIR